RSHSCSAARSPAGVPDLEWHRHGNLLPARAPPSALLCPSWIQNRGVPARRARYPRNFGVADLRRAVGSAAGVRRRTDRHFLPSKELRWFVLPSSEQARGASTTCAL